VVKKVGITDTTLRDGHQSLLATRMKIEDMLPIAEKIEQVGYHSLEVWGGATFDTCMRFLNEDPWERLRTLRKVFKNTKLQMLLRGQNLVGYKHYPDDVAEFFVKKAVENGIDIIRIFDALNDPRNMRKTIEATKKANAHVQATLSYTISPVHDEDHFVKLGKQLKEMGADSLCVKDMAGLISPMGAYTLVKKLKAEVGLPVQLHCHYTSGMASMAYLKAVEAGVDVIDCAISSLAMSTSQPAVETMVASLKDTEFDTGLDLGLLSEIAEYIKEVRKKYSKFDMAGNSVDTNVLRYQIPGGMLSNFYSQLAQQNALDKLKDVLDEVPRVREDFGYPPLVTPSSQIVGSQAVLNVLVGERYKMATNEVKAYMKGLYGKPPAPINEEVRKKIIGDEEPIAGRPADLLEPGLEQAKREIAPYMEKEEDILSYAIFPNVAKDFLEKRMAEKVKVDFNIALEGPRNGESPYHPV
jgi:oxaloacetate decarboxylase alpha subunit